MTKEEFALAHAKICKKRRKTTKGFKHRQPSERRHCGRKLYDFLTKHGIPLDIYYNQKKFTP